VACAGGKPGSVWLVNSLNLLVAVQGLNLPEGEQWFDLASSRFFMSPEDLAAAKKAQTASQEHS
jgi:hypothetical protein